MKVLMVNKFLYPNGGSETYIFKIGDYLKENGHEVEYFGMEHEGRIVGNCVDSYTSGMDFHTGKLQKLLYPLKIVYSKEARNKIRLVLEAFGPDVIHLNNFNFQLTPSIIYEIKKYEKRIGKKVPIFYTAHDYQLICPNHMMYNLSEKQVCDHCVAGGCLPCTKGKCIHGSTVKSFLGTIEGNLYRMLRTYCKIDCIIAPSFFMEKQLQRNKNLQGKIVPLHNFVEKVTYPLVEKKDYILYFGRYSKEKGILTLLSACESLSKIPFIFAGNGPFEDEVNKVENVKNVGFTTGNDLVQLIREARFTIIPSEWYENCPFSVMESQMYSTPVLGANIGGIPELIQDGKTGILFESGNKDELIHKINTLWNDKEQTDLYAKNCKDCTFDDIATYCEKLLDLYRKEV